MRYWGGGLCAGSGSARAQGTGSGHDAGLDAAKRDADTQARIGTEIYCSGVAFKFMVWLKPQMPYINLHCYVIRYAKGDFPTEATLYKNYTENRALDIMDTCRFKIMKKFKWYIPNTSPTTTGGEALTADGLVVQNWSTTKVVDADNYKVIANINPKQYMEWEAHILES